MAIIVTSKRGVRDTPVEPPGRIYNMLQGIQQRNVRAYTCFLYLTGCRSSEILGQRNKMKDRREKKAPQYSLEPIKVKQIDIGKEWLNIYGVPTLKRKGHPQRTIPIFRSSQEEPFINEVVSYLQSREQEDYAWEFSTPYARKLIKQQTPYHLHWLRGARATHLAIIYHLDAIKIQRYFNWAKTEYAALYAQLDVTDIKDSMKRGLSGA